MVFDEEKFTRFLKETSCVPNPNNKINYNRPFAMFVNLNGFKWICPKCFSLYKQNGKCSNCGMELAIEQKQRK